MGVQKAIRVAFTLDDIPLWPKSSPPDGFTEASIMQRISNALTRNGASGVYGFGNSWSLAKQPELATVLDAWVDAGHYVGNHTHNHPVLTEIGAERYCWEIDVADGHLAPWLAKAPTRFFRYTLCHWGDMEEKRAKVRGHLAARGYKPAEVTSWWYEWHWNRAWRNARDRGDQSAMTRLERDFVEACVVQLRHDHAALRDYFGRDVPSISLGHTVPFFAETADALFERLVAEGVEFISLDEAAADQAYVRVASVVSSKFLVYHQKLADAEGRPLPVLAPDLEGLHQSVLVEASGRSD